MYERHSFTPASISPSIAPSSSPDTNSATTSRSEVWRAQDFDRSANGPAEVQSNLQQPALLQPIAAGREPEGHRKQNCMYTKHHRIQVVSRRPEFRALPSPSKVDHASDEQKRTLILAILAVIVFFVVDVIIVVNRGPVRHEHRRGRRCCCCHIVTQRVRQQIRSGKPRRKLTDVCDVAGCLTRNHAS